MATEQAFTKTALLEEIHKRYNLKLSWTSLFNYQKKGWIKPSHMIAHGIRQVPVYTESDLQYFIQTLKIMIDVGKARVKLENV